MNDREPNQGLSQDQPSSLNWAKVKGDNRRLGYEKGLNEAVRLYEIPDSAFRHNRDKVIKAAVRLLSGYDMDPIFLEESERGLFALAISDSWLSTDSAAEKKNLLNILKLVATGKKRDENYGTLSGRVRVLSEHGLLRGTMFDPYSAKGNTHSEFVSFLQTYIRENTDHEDTDRIMRTLSDWDDSSKLGHVRKKLGIISREKERTFKVLVLNKTAQQMKDEVGYRSLFMGSQDGVTIVYNRDYRETDPLEHEYAHTQSDGLAMGYQRLLFRGVSEALTENSTSNPKTYPAQREVLKQIFSMDPEYESEMYRAYVGDSAARKILFKRIVKDCGLEGFLVLARINPGDNPKMSGSIGQSIYIEPQSAADFFAGHGSNLR